MKHSAEKATTRTEKKLFGISPHTRKARKLANFSLGVTRNANSLPAIIHSVILKNTRQNISTRQFSPLKLFFPSCSSLKLLKTNKKISFIDKDDSGIFPNVFLLQNKVNRTHPNFTLTEIFLDSLHLGYSDL